MQCTSFGRKLLLGYDDHQPRTQSGKETSVCVKVASRRHRLGVTIGVLIDRKAPQHGAKGGILILWCQQPFDVGSPTIFVGDEAGLFIKLLFLCAIGGTALHIHFFALQFFDFNSKSYFEQELFCRQENLFSSACIF